MHILFLSDNFPPEVNAPASRTFEHCANWIKKYECKITVITCFPNFPQGKVYRGYKNKLFQVEHIEGIRVIRVWSYITANDGTIKRIMDYISFMFMSFLASFFVRKVDIIIGTSPQFFTVCSAYAVSIFKRVPWVFELRDIWPESIKTVGALKKGFITSALEKLEIFLYHKATKIVSVTHSFKDNLIKRGIDKSKIHVVTNGVDLKRFKFSTKDQLLLDKYNLNGKFVAGYIGTHGMAHGLETIIDAANLASKKDHLNKLHFILLGDGSERKKLINKSKKLKLKNITFIDSVMKDDVIKYLSIIDVSIIHLINKPLFKTVIPSKIFESMGMGIPILHGLKGESKRLIELAGAGQSFEPEDHIDLLSSLENIIENPNKKEKFKIEGLKASKSYDRSFLASKMFKILLNTTKPS